MTTDDSSQNDEVYVDVGTEINALQNLFPTISVSEFYHVETGTIGVKLRYELSFGDIDAVDVLLEYPYDYPVIPPRMWVTNPEIDPESGMVIEYDHRNDARADYIDVNQWDSSMNGFHAAAMMKEWVAEYCHWVSGTETHQDSLEELVGDLADSVDSYWGR